MQNRHEDFGCLDLSIEVPRFTTLDHINKSRKFHAFQVSPLQRSFKIGQCHMIELHTEQILEGFTRVLKSFGKDLIELSKSLPLDTIMFDQGFESLQEKIDR